MPAERVAGAAGSGYGGVMKMKLPGGLPGFPRIAMHGDEEWGCVFSEDRDDAPFRYALWRIWDPKGPLWMYAMMNPADATHEVPDNTVSRCTERARQNGAGGVVVVNTGAYREQNPEIARAQADAAGQHNEDWVRALIPTCDIHIAAWGRDQLFPGAHENMKRIFREAGVAMKAIQLNKGGTPVHPSRKGKYHLPLVPFDLA